MLEALEGDPLPHKASGVDRKFLSGRYARELPAKAERHNKFNALKKSYCHAGKVVPSMPVTTSLLDD